MSPGSAFASASERVRIQAGDFDLSDELAALRQGRADVGAVASFIGYVRSGRADEAISALTLEHYPGMTERSIAAMIREAQTRFQILDARVVHRVGRLLPGEQIVLVAVAAPHRGAAFDACEFLMDYLKTHAPFWKKESGLHGERWVDARDADDEALARWGIPSANARCNANSNAVSNPPAAVEASPQQPSGNPTPRGR